MVGMPGFWLDVDDIFDQIFGQVLEQKCSVQHYWDGDAQETVLLGRKYTVSQLYSSLY